MPSSILLVSNGIYKSLLYSSHAWFYVYLLSAYASAEYGALLSTSLLLCVSCCLCPSSVVLIPFIIRLCTHRSRGRQSTAIALLLSASLVLIHGYPRLDQLNHETHALEHIWKSVQDLIDDWCRGDPLSLLMSYRGSATVISNHYLPGTGIQWYLQAQMLPTFQGYFDALLSFQPFICGFCVYHHISIDDPSLAVSFS